MKNFQSLISNLQKGVLPREVEHSKGFSLVETLVAVGILVVAVIGAMTAANSGISSSIYSKDQVVAFYLAQEAVEEVRNVRDTNALNGNNWLAGIAESSSDPCFFGKVCYADTLSATPLKVCDSGCPTLRQDVNTGFFGYDVSWGLTPYRREVELVSINSNEISIEVRVLWSKGVWNREFKVRENILNWQ